jgi:hypothetical protein
MVCLKPDTPCSPGAADLKTESALLQSRRLDSKNMFLGPRALAQLKVGGLLSLRLLRQ